MMSITDVFGTDDGTPHRHVVMTRWTLLIGAAYLMLYGTPHPLPLWQQVFLAGVLLSNLLLYAVAVRGESWATMRWIVTLADIATVTVAIAVVAGATNDFFLFFFLVLMLSGLSSSFRLTIVATVGLCAAYVLVLYFQQGPSLWRETPLLIRFPFLFGVGLFFGSVSDEARRERDRVQHLSDVTRKMVHRYHQVASERDRTQSLLEISQLALSAKQPDEVLHEITRKIQQTVRVDRCSMIIFNEGERHAYLAACSDDPDRNVALLLSLSHYPELQESLASGEITELHPDDPPPLWDKVKKHLPKPHKFRSWLVVPIMQNENVAGVFFLRDGRQDFDFHDDEKLFCKAAALMTAAYLQGCDLVEEMRRRSRLDGLTGLLNFQTFREELGRALDARDPAGDPKPLSLVMVDVDNLKLINDRFGHIVGNRAIQEVGRLLAKSVPMALATCRYGGDEFFALVPRDAEQTQERLERLVIELEQMERDEIPCRISVSVGIAAYPEDGEDADAFMDAADKAMYLAKSEGGNTIRRAGSGDEHQSRVFEAVISVNARRLIPGETKAFRKVLNELLRMEEKQLDSTAVQQSLEALMEAVESKDPYTNTHSQEVSDLTREVAVAMGLSERDVLAVEMAGLVHDIGKIGIPDEILQKPGKLTTRERMQIERHPEIGAQILKPLPALADVVPLVMHHHERWDGTGYPAGLKGEEIPLGSQIVAMCDVWHALTSDRSYRPAFTEEEAERIIREGRGTEWNPTLVDRFFEVYEDLKERAKRDSKRPQHQRSA